MGDGCPLLDKRCMIRDMAVKRSMENMISAIASVDLFSLLIGTEDACLPVSREDRNAQISIWHQSYSCLFCLLVK